MLIERAGAVVHGSRAACSVGRTAAPSSSSSVTATTAPTVASRHVCSPVERRGFESLGDHPRRVGAADLVIDAAFGTGFHGTWSPPDVGDTPVLAVDVPSGVDALTGVAGGDVLAADRTITFAAVKPGHLFPPGSDLVGQVEVADIGLDVARRTLPGAARRRGRCGGRGALDADKWERRCGSSPAARR